MLNLVDIKGSVGPVSIDAIGDIIAEGNINGPIEATGDHRDGSITAIRCTGPSGSSILGDVTSPGRIGWISAAHGNIGSSASSRVEIQCEDCDGYIRGQNVYADIVASGSVARVNATVGELVGSLSARTVEVVGDQGQVNSVTSMDFTVDLEDDLLEWLRVTGGDFESTSSLMCDSINSDGRIEISGDFKGNAIVRDSIEPGNAGTYIEVGGSLDGSITIGDDLNEDIAIEGDAGLTGQIIINADDNAGVWSGEIVVGTTSPITLTGDEYTTTATTLGGGAVGLVPFSTHRESCAPLYGADQGAPAAITLQFYGPVIQDTIGSDMPIKVYRGDYHSGSNEVDVTSGFSVEMWPGGDHRKVKIKPGTSQFKPQHRYRLVPITSSPGTGETILLCDDLLTASDVPVKGRDYYIDVKIVMSTLDLGGSGWVDSPDAAIWIDEPQDFNGDDNADSQDLQLIVDNLGEPAD